MKNKNYLLGMCLLVSSALTSQESQTTKAEKMGDGKFVPYMTHPSNGEYKFEGLDEGIWTIEITPYESDLKELKLKKREDSKDVTHYFPDNAAFPCTYISGRLQSHKAMVGYKGINFNNEERIVILDEWVYVIKKWKDKDHYVIDKCLKKGELKGMKLMKAAMGSKKLMESANHVETLQKYLDEAFKKQAETLVTTDGKKKSEDYENVLLAGKKRWDFVVDSINGGYWNSPEGKKKRAEMDQAKIILVNDTPSEFLFCHGQGVSTFLKPGAKYTFSCKSGKIYKGERIPNNSTNLKSTRVVYTTVMAPIAVQP
jgi:hypothetical protein